MIAARNDLESKGEKVRLEYQEHFSPMQKGILLVMFVSGFAFGILMMLILNNTLG
jgi:hypothetical protein